MEIIFLPWDNHHIYWMVNTWPICADLHYGELWLSFEMTFLEEKIYIQIVVRPTVYIIRTLKLWIDIELQNSFWLWLTLRKGRHVSQHMLEPWSFKVKLESILHGPLLRDPSKPFFKCQMHFAWFVLKCQAQPDTRLETFDFFKLLDDP